VPEKHPDQDQSGKNGQEYALGQKDRIGKIQAQIGGVSGQKRHDKFDRTDVAKGHGQIRVA
jgi:hypothetical protein